MPNTCLKIVSSHWWRLLIETRKRGCSWMEIFIAQAHWCLLVAAARATLINNTIKTPNTTEWTGHLPRPFLERCILSEIKSLLWGGSKGLLLRGLLFMDTVNAKVGSLFSVDTSLITTVCPFILTLEFDTRIKKNWLKKTHLNKKRKKLDILNLNLL